ncbi:Alanine--glyoxylate aminotransferase family protein [Sulfidibacter corallicola]|uniref:Alanine--glyoxylate aminotransferase family protein n=2 Tax=Sulfidibacter corallicola TaxID=2818388 RepID=A0A8A4TZH8_SULCO|nr:alanine--glyoxylate aminotransferase family protein [Sulfidibacter corallicola]QTD51915.1 alanine--glyoxylate aminotransferase family protein [Sulfidibacter corallicola]
MNQFPRNDFSQLNPPVRTLMGPGPSDIHPRVLQAMAAPTIGHLDPAFIRIMDEIKTLLQSLFQTKNDITFPVSGTGSAGMEACMVNVVEPGDRVVICRNGVFGARMADIAQRLGAELVEVVVPFGEAFDLGMIEEAIGGKPTKLVGVVHAETSTGVCQALPEIAALAHRVDALLLADCVTSLGGMPVNLDAWGVDLAYSGTQKCLSCPPGLAPVSFSPRAVQALKDRKTKVVSWYLDLTMLLNYWGGERAYHHTAPINMLYGLREALLVVLEEGLEAVYARHRRNHEALVAGIEAMGLRMLVEPQLRLPQLNTIVIPDGVDDGAVRRALLQDYNIEIGGGLGALKGKVWRVGLMGHASRRENVVTFLAALESILSGQKASIQRGKALEAAAAV